MKPTLFVLLVVLLVVSSFLFAVNGYDGLDKHWNEQEMDTAWLTFYESEDPLAGEYSIYFQNKNCYKCEASKIFIGNTTKRVKISTQFPWTISLEASVSLVPGQLPVIVDNRENFVFQEYGHYEMRFTPGIPNATLRLDQTSPGIFSLTPVIVAASVCAALAVIYKLVHILIQRRQNRAPESESLLAMPKHHIKPRLRSLDAFRGMSLFFMVFVNYGGGGYWFFNHSTWNGITFADLLFPWFVWIMGAAMPFALSASEKKKQTKLVQFLTLLRRSVTLFALGLFLNNGHFINYWRIPGVLQRFAIAYLSIGCLYLFIPKIGSRKERPLLAESASEQDMIVNADYSDQDKIQRSATVVEVHKSRMPSCLVDHFSDIFPFLLEYGLVGLLVVVWFLLTFLLKVPGCPTGYLGPGGAAGHLNCTGGSAGYIDRLILGPRHIYDDPTCKDQGPGDVPTNYGCERYDPEGIVGNLTSIFLCFLGLQAGRIMKTYQTHRARFLRLVLHGLIWAAVGTGLCGASKENGVIPLNKNLWSFSFVSLLGGLAFLLLSILFVLIDWIRIWKGAPFTYIGMNSIVVYMGHEILGDYFPFSWSWRAPSTHAGEFTNHWVQTSSNLCGACLWALIAFWLFKKKIFIRV